jgi:hypothetical protein
MSDAELALGTSPQFVNVPVPAHHVLAVMRFLADLESATASVEDIPDEVPEKASHGEWTDEDLARIPRSNKKALQILTDLLDVLSDEPEKWMNLANRTPWDRSTLTTVWTHITRAFKADFNGAWWPVAARSGNRIDPALPNVVYYRVTAETAEKWKRVRSSAS